MIAKGVGFERWLGNSKSYDHAMSIRDMAATSGTKLHLACNHLMHNRRGLEYQKDLNEKELKKYYVFQHWAVQAMKYGYKFVSSEQTVYSDVHGYAGTYDMLLDYGGNHVIADIKTGNIANKFYCMLQLSLYALAIKEQHNIDITDCLVIHLMTTKFEEYMFVPDFSSAKALLCLYKTKLKIQGDV